MDFCNSNSLSDVVTLLHCICTMQWHMRQCLQTNLVLLPALTMNHLCFHVDVCIPDFTENQTSKGMSVNFICMEFAGKRCPCRARVREFAPCVTQPQRHGNKSCNPWYCKTNMGADLIKTPFIWVHLCHTLLHAALWTNTEGRLWASGGNFRWIQLSSGIPWSSKAGDQILKEENGQKLVVVYFKTIFLPRSY